LRSSVLNNLLSGSLLVLLSAGCSLSLFNGYHSQPVQSGPPVSWFKADTGYFLFNARIDLMKNHFSGLMVVKPLTGGSYRVVFLTEVGLKIFDMEFLPGREVKTYYMLEEMNRKALVNTLTNDISMVLMNRVSSLDYELLTQNHSTDTLFLYKDKHKKSYYYTAGSDDRPYFVKQTSCITNKVRADLCGTEAGIDSIKIAHYNLRLKIALYRIREGNNDVTE
jgi:hypothetical protein